MFNVDTESIFNALNDIKKVISDNEKNSDREFEFHSFKAKNHPYTLAAIDGSNHNIRGTNFVFSTLRAGFHLFEKGEKTESQIDPIIVEFIVNNNDSQVGFEYKHEKYYHGITGEIPNGRLEFDKITERIRTLMEWNKVHTLLERLKENDIIIFDGSLISGEISTSHEFFNTLVDKARKKGISLVGLSKDTSLSIDSASLPLVLLESSKKQHPNKNWYVEYEGSYFVKFSKEKDYIFRVDAIIPEHLTFEDLISWVHSYCFHIPTFGYPFPMQEIHDSVRISELERDHCFGLFKQKCLENGIKSESFDKMFNIYHNQLDKISFGR